MGAVLSQEGEPNPRTQKPTQHPIAYYSATFTPTERNYDIYERELLAILKSLEHWRPHLAATEILVTVLVTSGWPVSCGSYSLVSYRLNFA